MFKALLVSVMIGSNGHPIEKTWGAFLEVGECNNVAGILSASMKESERRGAVPASVVFRCDPVETIATPKK